MKFTAPRIALFCLALVSAPHVFAGAAETTGTSKDYIVFFGLDVFVNDRGKMLPVVGSSERDILVREENGNTIVPRRDAALTVAVEPKLSRGGVTIDALDGYPVHSPRSDPEAESLSQMIVMQSIQADRQEASETAMRQSEASAGALTAAAEAADPRDPAKGQLMASAATARAGAALAASAMNAEFATPQFRDVLPGAGSNDGTFDGFEVTFDVSTPEPHANAYGVLRLIVRPPAQPGALQQALKVFRLRALDAKPRKVIVRRFDLPPGSTIESFEVHIYADGHELASSRARNRMELTEDEALQFLILRYMQRHTGATLPPQVADELRPEWPRAGIAAEWENTTVHLRITAGGAVEEIDAGAAIASPLTTELAGALRKIRFLPALVNGQPAASTGTFALGELFRPPEPS